MCSEKDRDIDLASLQDQWIPGPVDTGTSGMPKNSPNFDRTFEKIAGADLSEQPHLGTGGEMGQLPVF
jgi:hypothetical protein